MKLKRIFLSWLPTFIIMLTVNGIVHVKLAAGFFDKHLSHLAPVIHTMRDADPAWIIAIDCMVSLCMAWFITYRTTKELSLRESAGIGGIVNLIAAGTWNFANEAMFSSSLSVTFWDTLWHVCIGAAAGALFAWLYNRFGGFPANKTK